VRCPAAAADTRTPLTDPTSTSLHFFSVSSRVRNHEDASVAHLCLAALALGGGRGGATRPHAHPHCFANLGQYHYFFVTFIGTREKSDN